MNATMAETPTYHFHLSFLLHLAGFSFLLAGYSTPYWTLVKMSTGDVHSLGLVVSCFKNGCEMLHVTGTRTLLVIVFGLCTSTVVLSLFTVQAFCMAICNRSCRTRNVGTGFSYLSFLIAMSLAATLALYQIDLAEEAKGEMTIGWSRYSLISSAGAFLVGAVLNIADYLTRNRLLRENLHKNSDFRKRILTVLERNGHAQPDLARAAESRDEVKGKRLSKTVGTVMKTTELRKSLNSGRVSQNPQPVKTVTLVREVESRLDMSSSNVGGGNDHYRRNQTACLAGRNERANTTKHNLIKMGNVNSTDDWHNLPGVEEGEGEKDNKGVCDEVRRGYPINQESQGDADPGGASDKLPRLSGFQKNPVSETSPKMSRKEQDFTSKTAAAPKKHDHFSEQSSDSSQTLHVSSNILSSKKTPRTQKGRRGSLVEDAFLSVNHLVDSTIHLRPSVNLDTLKPLTLNKAENLPAVSTKDRCVRENVWASGTSNLQRQSPTTDKDDVVVRTKEGYNRSQFSTDTDHERMAEAATKTSDSLQNQPSVHGKQLLAHLSLQQIKRNQILKNLTQTKDRRKKRITQ